MSAPEQLGRLRRVRRIGAGGFATVWLYHDADLDSDVAVKFLADNWAADPGVRERFLAESRLLRRARSPHLVHVHDVGVTPDDAPYFVMSYADLGSVADLIDSGAGADPAEVVDLVTQAAEGLAALHAVGVVHRDIKPANLLLASDSSGRRRLMVADLGVAKALGPGTQLTFSVGTPSYMAPEQIDETAVVDARADVHALGAVAWALLTGRQPRARRWPGEPPAPVSSVRAAPPAVDEVVRRAMATAADQRWPEVTGFAGALADACRGLPAGPLPLVPEDHRPPPAPWSPPPPAPRAAPPPAPPAPLASAPPPPPPAPPGPPTEVRPRRGSTPAPTPAPTKRRHPRRGLLLALAAVTLVAVALGGTLAWLLANGGGPLDGRQAFEDAGVDYVRALQQHDCEKAMEYDRTASSAEQVCDPKRNLHMRLAQCLDVDGPRRVDVIGDDRARVVFVKQGYVEMIRGDNTLFRAGMMVASCG